MKSIFNGEIIGDQLNLEVVDRGLNFGDGVFETMVFRNGEVRYLDYHIERLLSGCEVLGIELQASFLTSLGQELNKLIMLNSLEQARVKLSVWRKSDPTGGYGFNSGQFNFLLQCKNLSQHVSTINKASFSQDIQLTYNTLSGIKTLSALPYVIAAKERQERRLDELILLSDKGEISECVASNIFWRKDNSWFTPALNTGCLAGVARRVLLTHASANGVFIQEVNSQKEALLQADQAVATNVTGIRQFAQLDNHTFEVKPLPEWMYL